MLVTKAVSLAHTHTFSHFGQTGTHPGDNENSSYPHWSVGTAGTPVFADTLVSHTHTLRGTTTDVYAFLKSESVQFEAKIGF